MKTAIVLVTYNHYELTAKCLSSLVKLPEKKFVIAVADNASKDFTPEKIQREFPSVKVFKCKKNLGFGSANNFAIKCLKSNGIIFDSICLLNNDTLIDDLQVFLTLQQKLEYGLFEDALKNTECILSPSTLEQSGKEQINYFSKISKVQFLRNAFRNEKCAAIFLQGQPVQISKDILLPYWTSAVCWCMKLSTWEKIDGFDERIFMYYEDFDFAMRALQKKVKFYILKDIYITHLGGGSAKNSITRSMQHDNSQEYVFYKHYGLKGLLLSKLFRTMRSVIRLICSLPKCFHKEKRTYIALHFHLLLNALRIQHYA